MVRKHKINKSTPYLLAASHIFLHQYALNAQGGPPQIVVLFVLLVCLFVCLFCFVLFLFFCCLYYEETNVILRKYNYYHYVRGHPWTQVNLLNTDSYNEYFIAL